MSRNSNRCLLSTSPKIHEPFGLRILTGQDLLDRVSSLYTKRNAVERERIDPINHWSV